MPHNAQDDERLLTLAESALARAAGDREPFLREACGPDTELFDQVWDYVRWEQRMDRFLLEPLFAPLPEEPPFEPGELLDGRFRILREVAQGGMGVVYEAEDQKLDRRIALKCAKAGFGNRLPPETRAATAISHPNVCKIFELHTASRAQGDMDFLTMEFLDGETLTDRISRCPVPEKEARKLALQLCAGLAEAHRNRIVHGDLKTNNVILCRGEDEETRAVITDFGLARRPGASHRAVQSGALGGTPDYMAPELLEGGKATVASDIYALGVILHELIFGRRPVPGQAIAGAPRGWGYVVERCLDPDPERRFQSAGEVAAALAPPSRRWIVAAAAATLLAIASAALTYQRVTAPVESMTVALLPFEAPPDAAELAAGVMRNVSTELARLRGGKRARLQMIPFGEVTRRQVATASAARSQLGATHVVRGTVKIEGGNILLRAIVSDTRTQADTGDREFRYAPGELRYAAKAIAGVVTASLRLPRPPVPPVRAEAAQDYLAGLAFARRSSKVDQALPLLRRAVEADPDSPLTWAGLAEAQWVKYFLTQDRSRLNDTAESVRQAQNRDSDAAAVHRIAGVLQSHAGLYESAAAEYTRANELEPHSDAYRRLGQLYNRSGRLDQALAALHKAIELDPKDFRQYQALGTYFMHRGDAQEAARQFEKCVQLAPDEPDAHYVLGTAYFTGGRYAEAERELRAVVALGEPRALNNLAMTLTYQGKDRDAIPFLLRAVERFPTAYVSWMNLGDAYRRTNSPADALRAYRRSLEFAEGEMARDPRDGAVRSRLAYLCARLGDRRRAESEVAQALQLSPNSADARTAAVWTYEALGRRDGSLAALEGSSDSVVAETLRRTDLADLQHDSRFQELARSRQIK
jgi:serine/threonine protein kinase